MLVRQRLIRFERFFSNKKNKKICLLYIISEFFLGNREIRPKFVLKKWFLICNQTLQIKTWDSD